jgi:dihydroorotate dehydrogenase
MVFVVSGFYETALRPLLFRVSADRAHELARVSLRVAPPLWRVLGASARKDDPRLETELAGIRLSSPIGLAPGFDKNAEMLPSLAQLGFGYLVVGSITQKPRFGNPFPRLVRYPDRLSITNSMGLPNRGLAEAVRLLRLPRPKDCPPVIASVAGFSSDELLDAAATVEPHVAAVEIGLVCPNTTETERLEELRIFTTLSEGLVRRLTKPVFIKLPPHHSEADRERIRKMVDVCSRVGIHGVSVSGTRPVVEPGLGMGKGSLAGRDVFEDAVCIVRDVVSDTRGNGLVVRAAGGIFSGQDALRVLEAGAAAVEVYSAFIYRGWGVAGALKRELYQALVRRGSASVRDLRLTAQPV